MKPTSIIFLIVAAALIITGVVTCAVASGKAQNEGVQLFETTNATGDIVEREYLSSEAVRQIVIRIDNADVHIIGGAEKSCLEMVNFPTNSYQYSVSGSKVTVGDSVDYSDLSSLLSLFTEGFHFEGLRRYIRFDKQEERQKTVNLYICDTDLFKRVDVRVNAGNVTVEKIGITMDYVFEIGQGDLRMCDNIDFSSVNASARIGNLAVDSSDPNGSLDLYTGQGNITVNMAHLNSRTVDLTATNGMVSYNGAQKGPTFTLEPLIPTDSLKAVAGNGNITYNTSSVYPPAEGGEGTASGTEEPSEPPAA